MRYFCTIADNLIELRVKLQLSAKHLSSELRAKDGKTRESRQRCVVVSGRVAGAIRGDAVAVTSTSITNLTAAAAAAAVVGLYTTD